MVWKVFSFYYKFKYHIRLLVKVIQKKSEPSFVFELISNCFRIPISGTYHNFYCFQSGLTSALGKMYNFALLLVTLLSLGNEVFGEDHSTTYEQLFELGMDAYRQEKWSKCAIFLQKAIDDYHFFKNAIIDCRLQCRSLSDEEFASPKLQVFHEMLEDSNCLRRCKKKKFGMRPDGPQPTALDKKFEKRAPYNFLQFCLFRV